MLIINKLCILSTNCTSVMQISEIKMAEIPDVHLSCLGVTKYGNFSVEIVDSVSDYLEIMEVREVCILKFWCFSYGLLFTNYARLCAECI